MVTDRVRTIADELRGTCQSLDDALMEGEELTTAQHGELDELIFCCDICSWWYDTGEMAEDCEDALICEKCGEDQGEE